MTPKLAKGGKHIGTSFKGVFAYLNHDKRSQGQEVSNTSDRVEWSEFRNLPTENSELAWRIMAATARNQDEIKRQAGQSVAGNKSAKSVFHYSLGWHPDEAAGLSKAEMVRAADESVRALNAEGYQAVYIAHNDTAHPHVHVVINRVNLQNGKMLDLWKSKENLSRWAESYERERGHIWCPQRVENNKQRDLGEKFSAAKDSPWHHHDQAQALGHGNDNAPNIEALKAAEKAKDAYLSEFGAKMHARHSAEWKAYSRDYQDGKRAIFRREKGRPTPFQTAAANVKADFKPLRSQLGKQQWRDMKDFERREKRLLGKLENAIAAASAAKKLGREEGGAQASLFNLLTSSRSRKAELEKLHRAQWRELNAQQSAEIGAAIAKVKSDQQSALASHRALFANRRQLLKDTQDAQKADLQRKWQTRHEKRARAFEVIRKQEGLRKTEKRAPTATRGQMRAEFNRKARAGRKRKGRVRKRTNE